MNRRRMDQLRARLVELAMGGQLWSSEYTAAHLEVEQMLRAEGIMSAEHGYATEGRRRAEQRRQRKAARGENSGSPGEEPRA